MSESMASLTPELLAEAMTYVGVDNMHGWRCSHPDRYGPCTCMAEAAQEVFEYLADPVRANPVIPSP